MGLETFVIGAHIDGACCLGQLLEKFKVLSENSFVLVFAREVVRTQGTASLAQHLLSLLSLRWLRHLQLTTNESLVPRSVMN